MSSSSEKTQRYLLEIDESLCKGCRLCIDFCPNGVLDISVKVNEHGTPYAEVRDPEKCIGCKACVLVCPDACIEIFKEEE